MTSKASDSKITAKYQQMFVKSPSSILKMQPNTNRGKRSIPHHLLTYSQIQATLVVNPPLCFQGKCPNAVYTKRKKKKKKALHNRHSLKLVPE